MPNLEEQLSRLGDSKYFGFFDVCSGLDYLPTSKRSQKYFNIVTAECCMTMLGAPMGWCNTPQMYQNRILEEILKSEGIYSKPRAGIYNEWTTVCYMRRRSTSISIILTGY